MIYPPEVSVVMSVFNGGKYLELAIRSILEQSFQDFEFIIINDGSTDDSEKIIKEFALKDRRIRLISRENRGLVNSLNEGVNLARAPLIARMDADDIALPSRFSEQLKYLKKNPSIVCVGSDPIIIDDDGDELIHLQTPSTNDMIQHLLLSGHCPIEHPSVVFRKHIFMQLGGYRKKYETAEDYDLWLRMGEVGELANINKPLIKYRYLNSSISGKNQKSQSIATRDANNEALLRRGVKCEFTATNEWRQLNDKRSKYIFAMKFGWWAFSYKNKKAANKYAWRAIYLSPFRLSGWKLLVTTNLKLP